MNKNVHLIIQGLLCGLASFLTAQSPPPGRLETGILEEQETESVKVNSWMQGQPSSRFQIEGTEIFTYPDMMECGQVLENLSAPKGARIVIPLEVGENLIRMTLSMSGGQGDADMYLSHGEVPGLHAYQYRPYVNGNIEEVLVEDPKPGRWFLMVHGYRNFSEVSVSLNCIQAQEERVAADFTPDQDIELALYYELSGQNNTNEVRNLALQNQLLNQQGREAFNAGRYNEALELWTQWMAQDPNNPRPVTLVGDLHLRMDDPEKAVPFYRKSLEIQPGQVSLMSRLSLILDERLERPEEAKELLNHFARLFPESSGVALAQSEWLIRRNRYEEAMEVIQRVVQMDPDNLSAMSLLHPLLSTKEDRYLNMQRMLQIGQKPGREINLGYAIRENDLLTKPESWVLMDFIYRMAGEAPSLEQRKLFENLLPRDDISVEDFRLGRMSNNWISSHQEIFEENGSLLIRTDPTQSEAFLRLKRSDAMHNGFVETWIDDSQGFFWTYARRGQGNMVRFGFAENGQLYLQVWMNNHLIHNQTRVWSRLPGNAVLRLELEGDGAMGYINGEPAFNSPVSVPAAMGLGWWGIAPWSPELGTARVTVSRVAGGPLPIRLGLIPRDELNHFASTGSSALSERLGRVANDLSTLAPEWYTQDERGKLSRLNFRGNHELRLMARYHRMRLLPMLHVRSFRALDLKQLSRLALDDRVDGFTLVVDRMPDPAWLAEAEKTVLHSGITFHFVLLDPQTQKASFRELCGNIGIFPGPRNVKTLSFINAYRKAAPVFEDTGPDAVIYLDNAQEMKIR